jgi:acetyl-CoA carboxylase carboxyltransferase component
MLDAIVDLRTPRFLVLVRNAFGGAYASYNNYATGADFVVALPTTRVAVMGPAGVEYVYKDELKKIRAGREQRLAKAISDLTASGTDDNEALSEASSSIDALIKAEEAALVQRYEREIMNPEEALSLGSISEIVMPSELRRVLARQLAFCLRHYEPGPMQSVQREFH